MRVLVLLSEAYGGSEGIQQFNRDMLRALCSHAKVSEVVAVARVHRPGEEELPSKLTYSTEGLNSKLRYIETVWKVIRSNHAFELVVVAHLNLLPFVQLLKSHDQTATLLVLFGLEAWSPRSWFYRRCLRRIDASASISEFTRDRSCAWSGFQAERVFLLPVAVDLDRFTPGPKNAELMSKYGLCDRTVLMSFGRLETTERAKGFDQVMEVLPDLMRLVPNLSFLICGDGTDRPRLERKARMLKIEKHVVFAGFVSEAQKVDHYRLADAYVMPSRIEGFGIVFLEAMGCGVPVMASKIDGSREAVREESWGVVVDPGNREEVKSGILEALRRPRGVRPPGLEYFSRNNFERRAHQIVTTMLEAR
jgi:phosphatidylinositol alpha-1,6-mannosyltransferase